MADEFSLNHSDIVDSTDMTLHALELQMRTVLEGEHIGLWHLPIASQQYLNISGLCKVHHGHYPDSPFTPSDHLNSIHPDDQGHMLDLSNRAWHCLLYTSRCV